MGSRILLMAFGILMISAHWAGAQEPAEAEGTSVDGGEPNEPPAMVEFTVPNLLFTIDEVERLELARRGEVDKPVQGGALKTVDARLPVRLGSRVLHLSSIVYSGPQSWAIWLNDRRITPNRLPDNMKSVSVFKNSVRFNFKPSRNKPAVKVRLRPNQSYLISSGKIIEGRAPRR